MRSVRPRVCGYGGGGGMRARAGEVVISLAAGEGRRRTAARSARERATREAKSVAVLRVGGARRSAMRVDEGEEGELEGEPRWGADVPPLNTAATPHLPV